MLRSVRGAAPRRRLRGRAGCVPAGPKGYVHAVLAPDVAAFTFSLDLEGADPALAARVLAAAAAHGARGVAVVGAHRWGLLAEIARGGLDVTAFDPSRAVLATAKRGLEDLGLAERVTLYAGDPRDAEVPGGVDAVLVTSSMWRILLAPESQRAALLSLRRALRGPALLLLDLDRVPPLDGGGDGAGGAGDGTTHLRDGPGRGRWTARRDGTSVRVTCEAPGVPPIPLHVSAVQPEDTIVSVRDAGFSVVSAEDAAGGALRPASARLWLVARRAPGAAPRLGDGPGAPA